MNREDLKELLKQSHPPAQRQPDCPADDELAIFFDGGLSEQGHEQWSRHLADCAYCLQRVGLLGRARETEGAAPVSEFVLARAERMTRSSDARPERGRRKLAIGWAAAAVIVLALGLVVRQAPETGPASGPGEPETYRETRSIDPGAMASTILGPRDEFAVSTDDGAFRWPGVSDSVYYQVRIVSDEGDLLWQERVAGTSWQLPKDLSLAPGAEYFIRVDAHLSDARSLNSDYVPFRAVGE